MGLLSRFALVSLDLSQDALLAHRLRSVVVHVAASRIRLHGAELGRLRRVERVGAEAAVRAMVVHAVVSICGRGVN